MFKACTGSSVNANARIAGKDAALKAIDGSQDVKLLFAYSSVAYDQSELLKGISEASPSTPIVGNTSFTGVILPEGFVTGPEGFVGVMALSDPDMSIGVAGSAKGECAIKTGKKVALEAMKSAGKDCPPDYFYMVASPGEEEFYLKGISKVIGRVPCFGGSAADNSIAGEWKLFANEMVCSDGVAVAFFYTDKPMTNLFTGAYRETNDVGIITKVKDNRTLIDIDGIPAVEKYASWRSMEPQDLKGGALLVATILSPLGVKDRLGDLVAIRHPMNGNDDNSMYIGANLAENTAIIRMEATVDELIDSTGKTLNELKAKANAVPGAFHLVHCGGRRAGIDNRIEEVYKQIKAAAGDVPFIVEFTFGEYGFESDDRNTTGGLMLSFTAFGS